MRAMRAVGAATHAGNDGQGLAGWMAGHVQTALSSGLQAYEGNRAGLQGHTRVIDGLYADCKYGDVVLK